MPTSSQPLKRQNRAAQSAVDGDLEALAVSFADTVIALRRVARRVVRFNLPELPSSESELLALVGRSKGIGVTQAARMLQVSPNTVSTMIKSLTEAGLLERLSDPSDRRAALLHLTAAGSARIGHIKRRRAEVLTLAMRSLNAADRNALERALPAMRRLLAELQALDPSKET